MSNDDNGVELSRRGGPNAELAITATARREKLRKEQGIVHAKSLRDLVDATRELASDPPIEDETEDDEGFTLAICFPWLMLCDQAHSAPTPMLKMTVSMCLRVI